MRLGVKGGAGLSGGWIVGSSLGGQLMANGGAGVSGRPFDGLGISG